MFIRESNRERECQCCKKCREAGQQGVMWNDEEVYCIWKINSWANVKCESNSRGKGTNRSKGGGIKRTV